MNSYALKGSSETACKIVEAFGLSPEHMYRINFDMRADDIARLQVWYHPVKLDRDQLEYILKDYELVERKKGGEGDVQKDDIKK
jgi:hypothetical protein